MNRNAEKWFFRNLLSAVKNYINWLSVAMDALSGSSVTVRPIRNLRACPRGAVRQVSEYRAGARSAVAKPDCDAFANMSKFPTSVHAGSAADLIPYLVRFRHTSFRNGANIYQLVDTAALWSSHLTQ